MKVLCQAVILLDCSKDGQVECIIEETGFECFNEHVEKKLKYYPVRAKPPSTEDLDVCIPKDLKIRCIDESTFLKVIVWSPELGCQIVHREYPNRDTCFTASLFCPCLKDEKGSGKVRSTNSLLLVITLCLVQLQREETEAERLEREEYENYQNENAHYSFNSKVDDNINDGQIARTEEREGGTVRGSYSYFDGFVKRRVEYIADKDGYRVLKDEMEDAGTGPKFNPDGTAIVEGSLIGKYQIKLDKTEDEKHYKDVHA
ncbi:uncharacterized protein LOC122615147 isoform X2 [Drosophila teissieri]|uniref:uncharacterized protein LOC122615147 isoform X2 n=1 Tax=Drosophila teissieri TaxID=7243 RepID=UPI001CBA2938|nr:uncharacterized protein LOC122615147 isoform X2 [Drosophila teissieri]